MSALLARLSVLGSALDGAGRHYKDGISADNRELAEAVEKAIKALEVVNAFIGIDNITAEIKQAHQDIDRALDRRNVLRSRIDALRPRPMAAS